MSRLVSSILPKNERKQFNLRYDSTVSRIFLFVFWKNSRHQKDTLKLTELFNQSQVLKTFVEGRLSYKSTNVLKLKVLVFNPIAKEGLFIPPPALCCTRQSKLLYLHSVLNFKTRT